jgi:hypothetical protein
MVVGLSIGGLGRDVDGRRGRRGIDSVDGIDEQAVVRETGIPLPAVGVEDPKRRRAPWRSVPVMGDERLGALADDIATQADP